ncbi:MAG: hypothetical protein HYV26_17945 [Candidatus Hydrogenedentes bacterium]|nr:hypothetical protein [Candidatus Hydrogenedentota bacterium]MBI3118584.1 hypothetical protein [Candidatus Hydrogenedentota bacterium]
MRDEVGWLSDRRRRLASGLVFYVAAWMTGAAGDENLLQNGGFEAEDGGKPAAWDVFVGPQAGALADVDVSAHGGKAAAMLFTPEPYETDPINNWSQNVLGVWGGHRLELRGFIKSENAGQALLWLQCWRRQPWGVLHIGTTSEQVLVGTQDWTEVSTEVDVPVDTDFLTVRCVLKGAGRAWFDDVSLRELPPAPVETKPPAAGAQAPGPSGPEQRQAQQELGGLENALGALKSDNQKLSEMLRGLREENKGLSEELQQLREELQRLQENLHGNAAGEATESGEEKRPAPALVPHGENPERYR